MPSSLFKKVVLTASRVCESSVMYKLTEALEEFV